MVEHLSSYPCYFTHISNWRWHVWDPHLFSVLFLVHVATSLWTSENLCVIHLPSVPTSTPGCDNNVSMQDVVLQVAVCMWHNHLRVVSMKTFSYHPSFAVLQIPATTFTSNLTNQFFWYNAHIWYEKASHVCACHYSSKADCPRSLLKDDECLYCAPMVDALPLFLSFMSAGQMLGMQYPHLHFILLGNLICLPLFGL